MKHYLYYGVEVVFLVNGYQLGLRITYDLDQWFFIGVLKWKINHQLFPMLFLSLIE